MATLLDTRLFSFFGIVFPFLLMFAMTYALLAKFKILGDSNIINATVAAAAAFMSLLSDTVIAVITFIAPWFVVAFIFLVLLLLMFQIMGAKDSDFNLVVRDKAVQWTIVGIGLLIVVAGFAQVLGQDLLENAYYGEDAVLSEGGQSTNDFQSNLLATLFHPKILGMIVLFGIAIFAVAMLTGNS